MAFIHAYNPKEKDTVLPESRDNVARAWNLQKSANQRMRTASLNGIVRHPASFDQPVSLDAHATAFPPLKNAILSLQVPYVDTRQRYAPVFESVEYTRRRVLQKWEHPELFVVFLPQHEKYASNVIENLALHLNYQLSTPQEYLNKVFRRVHIRQQATRIWDKNHKKVFSQAHMSAAISEQHMAHHFADLNIDMALVLQDAAKKATTSGGKGGGSIPKASESQHLSIGMASLLGEDDMDADIFYRSGAAKSTPVTDVVSYAAMVSTQTPQSTINTPPNKPTQKQPAPRQSRSRSQSHRSTPDELDRQRQAELDRKRQSDKAKAKSNLKPAAKSTKAPTVPHQDDFSTLTAEDARPTTVATISVGGLSVDQSSITADTAALLQAQHATMQAKLAEQASKFEAYIKSLNQTLPSPTPQTNSMSETAHNSGGGPAL
jgi:hypothetical protein